MMNTLAYSRRSPRLALALLMLVLPCAHTSAQEDQQTVNPQRARLLIEQRMTALQERLERLEALQARLDQGDAVQLKDLEDLLDRSEDRPGPGPRGERRIGGEQARDQSRDPAFGPGGGPAGGPRGIGLSDQPAPPPNPWRSGWSDLDDERKARVMAFLEEHTPEAHRRLSQSDPSVTDRFLARSIGPRVMRVLDAQDRDPELGELTLEEFLAGSALLDAGMRMRQAHTESGESSEEFSKARSQFREALVREVDAKLALRQYEFGQLERRIALQRDALREEHEQRSVRIDEAMQQTLDRLRRSREPRRERGGND